MARICAGEPIVFEKAAKELGGVGTYGSEGHNKNKHRVEHQDDEKLLMEEIAHPPGGKAFDPKSVLQSSGSAAGGQHAVFEGHGHGHKGGAAPASGPSTGGGSAAGKGSSSHT